MTPESRTGQATPEECYRILVCDPHGTRTAGPEAVHRMEVVVTRVLRFLTVLVIFTASIQRLAAQNAAAPTPANGGLAIAIEREVERIAAASVGEKALWPGFDPLTIPLAVFDGERTFLFRHPAPPEGFKPVPGAAPGTCSSPGRSEAVTANSNSTIGGIPTATLLLSGPQAGDSAARSAAVAIHEAFHVFQRAHHPAWTANEADLFTYPVERVDLLVFRRLETEALRRALVAKDDAGAACWARRALAMRGKRFQRMDAAFRSWERGTELNEGLATYVEARAAGRLGFEFPSGGFAPSEVRRRAYSTGLALASLLDRFAPGWPAALEADDGRTIDGALEAALGPGEPCEFGDDVLTAAAEQARTDVAALEAERTRRLAAFEGKPGWRVVVEAGGEWLLWPQGFDPMNVERLTTSRVLHTRFLRLGSLTGRIEVMNTEAVTEGVGSNPLLQGVRRVVVTGLAEPVVTDEDGIVRLRAPGLTAGFKGGRITRSGQTVVVNLGP